MANVNGTEIDLMPTDGMREEAERYRAWKQEGEQGGTEVAATRASQILSGNELSADTVITMSAWFARHEVDKQGEGFSPGSPAYPSPGRVAWAAWGGDPGKPWSDKRAAQIKAAQDRANDDTAHLRAEPDALKEGDFVSWNSSGGTARGRIEHVMREGTLGVPDSSFSIEATPDDPAALIRIYRPQGGGWSETETLVGHKFSTLRKIEPLRGDDTRHIAPPQQRPYENEHAARLLDPDQFDEFRRRNNEFAQGIDSIYGISGDDPVRLQALRFDASTFTVSQARKWLSDHDYNPIEFELATGKTMSTAIDIKSLSKEVLRREAPQGLRVEERDDAGLTFSFSSEAPVERFFGREILVHDPESVDLARMNDGGPWLWNHNRDVVLGVAEKSWLGSDRRLYVKTKWSPNTKEQGTEEYKRRRDIEAGIVRNVSFAYEINDIKEAPNGDMLVTRFNVLEVSSVSVPADQTVGLGRSLSSTESTTQTNETEQQTMQPESPTLETKQTAERGTDTPLTLPSMEQTIDIQEVQAAARQSERERVAAIRAMCDQHKVGVDLAERLINDDASIDQAREAVLKQLSSSKPEQAARLHNPEANDIGLSKAETKRFSFIRALNYLANPGDVSARRAAEFEIEVGRAAAAQYERSSNGIVVPNEVLRRDLVAEIPTAGGNLVPDELLAGSFIDLLRNRLALAQAGVTTLTGLQGNISIPRQTSAATAYWVGENVAPTESQQAIDQVNMTPKTVAAFVDYSRRLLLQSSIDVEGMIRNDLARVIALEIDRAAIYGTGSSNQPLGLTLTPGIGTETLTNAGTFTQLIAMETDVAVANADVGSLRYIMNATARGLLKSTSKAGTEAVFVWENNEVNGYPVIVSNQLQGNDALFGDFSQMVMGMWSGLDLMVDPYAGATAGTVRVIAHQDLDVAVKQPGSFCLGT